MSVKNKIGRLLMQQESSPEVLTLVLTMNGKYLQKLIKDQKTSQ